MATSAKKKSVKTPSKKTVKMAAVKKPSPKKKEVTMSAKEEKKASLAKAVSSKPASKTVVKVSPVHKKNNPSSASAKPVSVQPKQPLYEAVPTAAQTQKAKQLQPPKPGERFSQEELNQFKEELTQMRDRILSQAGSMKDSALKGTEDVNPEEDGTDANMRLVTLKQVSTQSQILAKIEVALHAIEKGTYGICDSCGQLIRKQRLQVQPFAKTCIHCQSEMEKNRLH